MNGYIDNTGDLLGLSSEGFSKLKKLMNDDYKKTLAEAVVSQRNAYAQAMADAETAMNQAQSALEASQREANESAGDALGNFSASSILSIAAGNKWEFFKNLKPWFDASDVESDARQAVEDTANAYQEAKEKYDDYISRYPELREELGITIDETACGFYL